MNAAEVVNQAAAAGVRIAVNGSDLSLEATEAPPNAILELINQHKQEIIALPKRRLLGSTWWLLWRTRQTGIGSGATS